MDFFTCDCGEIASVSDEFLLESTDGPVLHFRASCLQGHHFLGPADRISP